MSLGIKVSTEGNEVGTAAARYLNMATDQNMFKVFAFGSGSIPSGGSVVVTHNLGYQPNFQAWIQEPLSGSDRVLLGGNETTLFAIVYCGTSTFEIYDTADSGGRGLTYYVMYDPL